jgi:hypothetical protein
MPQKSDLPRGAVAAEHYVSFIVRIAKMEGSCRVVFRYLVRHKYGCVLESFVRRVSFKSPSGRRDVPFHPEANQADYLPTWGTSLPASPGALAFAQRLWFTGTGPT